MIRRFAHAVLALATTVAVGTAAASAGAQAIGTFSNAFDIPTAPPSGNGDGKQEMAVSPSGDIVVGWISNWGNAVAPSQVRILRGGTWSAVTTLNAGMRTQSLALPARTASNGDVVVVWGEADYSQPQAVFSVLACAYVAASATWCNTPDVLAVVPNIPLDPDVTVLPDGTAVATWSDYDPGRGHYVVKAVRRTNSTWGTPQVVSDAGSSAGVDAVSPQVASDDAGTVMIAFWTGAGTAGNPATAQSVRSPAGTESWSDPIVAAPGNAQLYRKTNVATLRMSPSGTTILTYTLTDTNDDYGVAVVSPDAGSGWTAAEVMGAFPAVPTYWVTGDAASTGEALVAYEDNAAGTLMARRWLGTSAGWGAPTRVPAVGADTYGRPGLAMDGDGNALVAWVATNTTPDETTWARRLDGRSGEWSVTQQVSTSATDDSRGPVVVGLDPRGAGLVSWTAGGTPALLGATYASPDTAPWAPGAPTATAGDALAAIAWTVPAFDGGSAITSYTVTASPGGATCTATAPATTCTVTGLANGTAYTFTVAATNAAGTGRSSAPSAPVTPIAPSATDGGAAPVPIPTPAWAPALTFASRTFASTQVRSVTLTTNVRVNGAGRVAQVGRSSGVATSRRAIGTRKATATRAPVACTARRTVPRAGTYRITCTLGRAARAQLTRRALRVRLATVFIATDGQRVTRISTVRVKRLPAPRLPVTG